MTQSKNQSPKKADRYQRYWRANIRAVCCLLAIWLVVAYGCGILFIESLNQIKIGSVGLGFWVAQQGSIYIFVGLVLAYALWMDRLDRKFDVRD